VIDPRNIRRPAMFPLAYPCRMTTTAGGSITPDHSHHAYPNAQGEGTTDIVVSHFHYIRGGQIIPSPVDGHTHILTKVFC
jgi:hypothetical protein